MPAPRDRLIDALPDSLRTALFGPPALAFAPALALAALWFGGERGLLALAFLVPALLLLIHIPRGLRLSRSGQKDHGSRSRREIVQALDATLAAPGAEGETAALALALDDAEKLLERHGPAAAVTLRREIGGRLAASLREGDMLRAEGTIGFRVALAPTRRLDIEALVQLSARLQRQMDAPVMLDAQAVHATMSVGFCLPRHPDEMSGGACLDLAEEALALALQNGPGAIRAHATGRRAPGVARGALSGELAAALDEGQLTPWFQPQLSTDTGAVSGMEALARWEHPDRGLVMPADFLPIVEAQGLHRRLTDAMLDGAFAALARWDAAGLDVPRVSINLSAADLADPLLAERIGWELDRFELGPERLAVEVLETVLSGSGDEVAARTLSTLEGMGCGIDLDDFGTGHAAIASIRRFSVGRVKIDRSFVRRVDTDADQQTMLTAILDLADRLGIETLAEGVETVSEHALLAQLGCRHVQGFAIARPMPAAEAEAWLARQSARASEALWPHREAG